ncbi:E3 ubiquitin-protein ligase RFI2-like isoform X2 [Durio zibethinus]|uniref:E3 ubiquitin-protein ligase RFI2-like isoform X2 n=1 Tax=Durio zibethinus TaxID=66656 RepID=A0A6P6B1A7_DURZI|nr:E3 ubiquitin-protein ligase RFI2-like isoform X2 [Durio zibethinus]
MVGSNGSQLDRYLDHDHHHQLMDGRAGNHSVPTSSEFSCSICLDLVSDTGGRSRAKLQCGHEFHLDCIGSAFNMKGAMQCPNCRKVEKGRWWYANGSTRSLPELSTEDWHLDYNYYDPVYSEMPFRAQWCPFGEFTRTASSSEEVESPSTTYHEIHEQHGMFAEHTAASSLAHSYVAYVGPRPSTTLRSSDSVDDPNFNRHWNIVSGHNEIFIPYALPTFSIQYHSWGWHSPNISVSDSHISNTDPASIPAAALRSFNGELDAFTRPRSFPHPFPFEYGSRGGSSFVSSVIPRHPGSGAHTYDRIQVSLAYYRQQHRFNQQHFNRPGVPAPVVPGMRRGLAPVAPAILQPDQSGSFYIYPPSSSSGQNLHEAESFNPNNCSALVRERLSHFPIVSRVSGWGSYHPTSRSDSGHRSRSFIHWHFA